MKNKNTKIEKQSSIASIIKTIGILILVFGVLSGIVMLAFYLTEYNYYYAPERGYLYLWSSMVLIVGSVISWATLVGFGEIIDYLYKISITLNNPSK